MRLRKSASWLATILALGESIFSSSSWAIEVTLTPLQVEQALARGVRAAEQRLPPNRLYAWFGSEEELKPKGFLMTKMNGLTVMAAHFALRGKVPSLAETERILQEETMLVSVTLFGETPTFAKDSYMILKQGDRLIKPVKVRFDGVAHRTSIWPNSPRYQAKVIAAFRYEDFDPHAMTTLLVFPGQGGEQAFKLDFSQIP
ncbi:MAG: hypothetical protein D6704_04420 [Nitrospirae bacterium]|nr:MAG: hypothetical protein D6704_04420 [Nitrospirota bacterium]